MSEVHFALPPLLEGQHLTVDEFLRRWEAMPELKRAELIDGVVYMPSPVSIGHWSHDVAVITWLATYAFATPGCHAGNNGTWLMAGSVPQPDAFLYVRPEYGGQSRVEEPYMGGAPEFVAEVTVSSSAHDLGPKLALYQRAGVLEYVSVLPQRKRVVWRVLQEDRYRTVEPDADGVWRSSVFPGLWLDREALLGGDGARLLSVLREGLASEQHERFVAELARRRK